MVSIWSVWCHWMVSGREAQTCLLSMSQLVKGHCLFLCIGKNFILHFWRASKDHLSWNFIYILVSDSTLNPALRYIVHSSNSQNSPIPFNYYIEFSRLGWSDMLWLFPIKVRLHITTLPPYCQEFIYGFSWYLGTHLFK